LTSVSSTTIAAGSDNQVLTVTGTGFLAGATATWNGAARTTTFIDASHVQVAIPASDVAAALSVSVKVTNPGSVDSNALTLAVQ
jgi:nitrogen regulatory protein PII